MLEKFGMENGKKDLKKRIERIERIVTWRYLEQESKEETIKRIMNQKNNLESEYSPKSSTCFFVLFLTT